MVTDAAPSGSVDEAVVAAEPPVAVVRGAGETPLVALPVDPAVVGGAAAAGWADGAQYVSMLSGGGVASPFLNHFQCSTSPSCTWVLLAPELDDVTTDEPAGWR